VRTVLPSTTRAPIIWSGATPFSTHVMSGVTAIEAADAYASPAVKHSGTMKRPEEMLVVGPIALQTFS